MSVSFQPLVAATPAFNERGIIKNETYNDVYHSTAGAQAQTDYVFLQGNDLPKRWQGQRQFTIAETGFGLGGNFLVTWLRWRQDPQRSQRLHFLSFEAHPFQQEDLAQLLQRQHTGELKALAHQLAAKWPLLLPGIHRLEFEHGAVTLTLVFGDITAKAPLVNAKVDAFYLDGFAPSRNPSMWSPRVLGQLVRLSAPQATFATWCSAGQVRRDLQNAGFLVEKVPGFAHKRDMLRGQLRPHLGRRCAVSAIQAPIAIIGGGIAGAATAYALARRGFQVEVFDPVFKLGLGGSHANHRALAMTPLLSIDDAPRVRLSRAGCLLALSLWHAAGESAFKIVGSYRVATSAEETALYQRSIASLAFPKEWVQYKSADELAAAIQSPVPYGGLYFPYGALIQPETLLGFLLSPSNITTHTKAIARINAQDKGWQITDAYGKQYFYQQVVIATAAHAQSLLPAELQDAAPDWPRLQAMENLPGQVSDYDIHTMRQLPQHILAGEGYLLPPVEGYCVGGSTYGANAEPAVYTTEGEQALAQTLARWRPLLGAAADAPVGGWVGYRAALKDHLPLFGEPSSGLWLLSGLGSNGFAWSSILAEELAAQLSGEPSVLERDLSQAVGLR